MTTTTVVGTLIALIGAAGAATALWWGLRDPDDVERRRLEASARRNGLRLVNPTIPDIRDLTQRRGRHRAGEGGDHRG